MEDDSLQHLLPRKAEINGVSTWASVKLRFIRDDLEPLIARGVPIKHLLRLLAPLEITRRRETMRQFVLDEFPQHYARYYAKRATAERIKQQETPVKTTRENTPSKAPDSEAEAEKPKPSRGSPKRLNVDNMLTQVGDFAAGKQFDKEGDKR